MGTETKRVYRYMGLEEFYLLIRGEYLRYTSTRWESAKSSSDGFCFLNMFTDFTSEDFDGSVTEHTFNPIQCYEFLYGIVEENGVLVEFATTPESGLIDSTGIYADPINSGYFDATIGIDEKYTEAYNRDTLIPLRYRLVNGSKVDEKWYNVENIPKAQAILAGVPYEYETNNEKVIIKKYMGTGTENEEISVPEKIEGHSVTEIGKYAFMNDKLTDVSNVKSIMLPNTIENIGDAAFYGCKSLENIKIPDSVAQIGKFAFKGCESLENITIPDSVTRIGESAFDGCKSLESVVIPNSVTEIGEDAFYGCKSLENIKIPDSVAQIGKFAFAWCESLESITIPNSVTKIGEYAFTQCTSLKSIEIPNSVTEIGENAFYSCTSLKEITIPEKFKNQLDNIFDGVSLDNVKINYTRDGKIVETVEKGQYKGEPNQSNSNVQTLKYKIHDNYVGVFTCNEDATSVVIPETIEGKPVTEIEHGAFERCESLKSIEIPDSVTKIGENAFSRCESLKEITIPNSVTEIGEEAFCGCESLKSIEIPNSVKEIGKGAFGGCTLLKEITIPNSVTEIGIDAFTYCTSLENIKIPDSVTQIGYGTFIGCESLKNITIPDAVTKIGVFAFEGCTSLKEITIPNSITQIGGFAFESCKSLKEISIPDSVTQIDSYAFEDCISLKEITIPEKFKNQLDNIFVGVNLDNVKINYTRDGKTIEAVENNKTSAIQNGMVSGNKNVSPSTLLSNTVTIPSARGRK